MYHTVSVSSNAGWNVFPPVLLELPRFKGLDRGCIFHGATDRLTLHYCDDRSPLRLTRKCTHLADLLWDSKHLQPRALVKVCMCAVLINIHWKIYNDL